MSIENPTLAHFRHFSSLLTNLRSTFVENSLQISPFYAKQTQFQKWQNEHKHFYNNEIRKFRDLAGWKNKANSNPIQSQFKPKQTQLKPIQTQFKPNFKGKKKKCISLGPIIPLFLCHISIPSEVSIKLRWIAADNANTDNIRILRSKSNDTGNAKYNEQLKQAGCVQPSR
ncbi:MAG: hypothetical protein ISS76_02950 [Phycisphaerae bacterium]|nr:hypothetical protein [Phycisphaerae bacterium]